MDKRKLNIFQRGAAQRLLTLLVYFACLGGVALVIDTFEKWRFSVIAEKAAAQNIIPQSSLASFKDMIGSADSSVIFMVFLLTLFCAGIGYFLLKLSTRLNLAWPVIVPKVVEFSSSLRKIGIIEPGEQIAFVRKHKLPVFIAASPILGEEGENISARLYIYAHKPIAAQDIFERNIGKRTLCLDADDYARIVADSTKRFSLEESAALTEKEEELHSLKVALASMTEDKARLESQNSDLQESLQELKNKAQTQPAQEESRVERLRVERLQWAAFTPAMEKLMQNAPAGKKFTTRELEEAFSAEWDARPDLRERMRQLTDSAETKPSETILSAVKAEFKDAGMFSAGGRPRKNL
ncbi:MAG: hypothetical protein DELT_02962 [Desulfovibrio sp.]